MEFITCHDEAKKSELRDQAVMSFHSAFLIAKLILGSQDGTKQSVMDAYPFLWSDEERKAARVAELKAKLESKSKTQKTDAMKGEG